jgi:large repetitive protein
MRTGRLRYPVVVLVAWDTGLAGTLTVQGTRAAFSDTTSNPGNTFQAASSFCVGGGTQTVIATQDSRVHEDLADTNFGGSADLRVRTYWAVDRRTLVSFPLPAVPANCTLASATLRLFASSAEGDRTIDAYRAASAWSENTVTWNNRPLRTGSAVGSPSSSGWIQWDVTAHVAAMYSGSNFGFILRDRNEASSSAQQQTYRSTEAFTSRPELVVAFG